MMCFWETRCRGVVAKVFTVNVHEFTKSSYGKQLFR